jgi:hypothetical protein
VNTSEQPVLEFRTASPQKQRRVTVFFRLFMLVPHVVLAFVAYAMYFAVIFGWFAAIFIGRNPYQKITTGYLRWYARLESYAYFLTDVYPPFTFDEEADYPTEVMLEPGRLNRVTVFFRLILVVPAALISALVSGGMFILAVISWFIVLFRGTLPKVFHNAFEATIRYNLRVAAYMLLVQNPYPRGLFGDPSNDVLGAGAAGSATTWSTDHGDGVVTEFGSPLVASETSAMAQPNDEVVSGIDAQGHPRDRDESFDERSTSKDWTLTVSRAARSCLVVMMLMGLVVDGLYILVVPVNSFSTSTSPTQSWTNQYKYTIADVDFSVSSSLADFSATPVNWSAIGTDCATIAATFTALKTVPQYPSAGPDKTLLVAIGLIAQADGACTSSIVPTKDSSKLASMTTSFTTGEKDLRVFLNEV